LDSIWLRICRKWERFNWWNRVIHCSQTRLVCFYRFRSRCQILHTRTTLMVPARASAKW
jgi:hypothetical protein